jgi:hypothetical protein
MRRWQKLTLSTLVVALLLLVGIELIGQCYFPFSLISDRTEGGRYAGEYFEERYFQADLDLGYMPPANVQKRAAFKLAGYPIYDVHYTTNEYGLRQTKGNDQSKLSFVFLGCGMTFGEGLSDDETLPSYYSSALDFQHNVINFGVNGYGPHHALRVIESGRLSNIASGDISSVYFETAPSHMVRSFVPRDWDLLGPQYVLTKCGKSVQYVGPRNSYGVARVKQWLMEHSWLVSAVSNYIDRSIAKDKEAMLWLYLQIIKHAKVLVETKLQSEFRVILWDEPFEINNEDLTPFIIDFMKREGIEYSLTSDILKTTQYSRYMIPYDGHPNALANELIGNYLAHEWNENI